MKSETLKLVTPYLQWLTVLSLFTFFISIVAIPWYVSRLPQDYFRKLQTDRPQPKYTIGRIASLFFRNLIGIVLFAAGILMLFLPGQGLITLLIGLLCMTFPGKRSLLLRIIGKDSVQKSLNWTRRKMKRPPFTW